MTTAQQQRALAMELEAVPENVARARHAVGSFAGTCGASAADAALATSEAITNAIIHGYRDGRAGRVSVRAETNGPELELTVEDAGVGMTPHPESPGLNLGLAIIATVARDFAVDSHEGGVRLRMTFPLAAAKSRGGRLERRALSH
jgi:serine/threonine-protein kinase RsbW